MQSAITNPTILLNEVMIELSYNCNFKCIMCGFGRKPIFPEHFMSSRVLECTIERIQGCVQRIRLNGRGESTLHPNFTEIITRLRTQLPFVTLSLFTNLSCNPTVLDVLMRNQVQLFVSMDSCDPVELEAIRKGCNSQSFFKNLNRLKTSEPKPFIVFTLQPGNLHRISDISSFARSLDFGIIFNILRSNQTDTLVNLVIEHYSDIRNAFKRVIDDYSTSPQLCQIPSTIQGIDLNLQSAAKTAATGGNCPAIYEELCIRFDGSVTPCNMFNPTVIGNIITCGISEIISGPDSQRFQACHMTSEYCHNCSWMEATS